MFELLKCDSCSRPLGEGALARNEAVEREGLLVCAQCLVEEAKGGALPIRPTPSSVERWKTQRPHLEHPPQPEISRILDETTSDPLPTDPLDHIAKTPRLPRRDRPVSSNPIRANGIRHEPEGTSQRSPMLAASLILLMIVLPAFIWSLVEQSKRSNERDSFLNKANTNALAHNELQNRLRRQEEEIARLKRSDSHLISEKSKEAQPIRDVDPSREERLSEEGGFRLQPESLVLLDELEAELARPVVEGLASPSQPQRLLALAHAIRHQSLAARASIRHHLQTASHPVERELAALALGEIGDSGAVALLRSIESRIDTPPNLRSACKWSLNMLDGQLREVDFQYRDTRELQGLMKRLTSLPEATSVVRVLREEIERRGGEKQ